MLRVFKSLLVFALLISFGALAQTQTTATGGCGTYPRDAWVIGYFGYTWVFPWFAAEGDPAAEDIATSPGWKSWIGITNLSKKPVSVRLEFYKPEGNGKPQIVWSSLRGGSNIMGANETLFEISPSETVEVRLLAKAADISTPTTGLATGSIKVVFLSDDPCVLDLQGKLALTFLDIKSNGTVSRLATVDAVKLSDATNQAFANITATPASAREGNPAVEIPSSAVINLSVLPQDVKITLLNAAGQLAVAPKFVTLAPGEVFASSAEDFFGIEALGATGKVCSGRWVFEGLYPLAVIALGFVGPDAMGSRKVWPF